MEQQTMTTGAPAAEQEAHLRGRRSSDLAAGVVEEVRHLVDLEIRLAKTEMREMALRNAIAAGLLGVGGILLGVGVLVALPVLLVTILPSPGIVAAIWLGLYVVGGVALGLVGRGRIRLGPPERTLATLKEDREWALRQTSSSKR